MKNTILTFMIVFSINLGSLFCQNYSEENKVNREIIAYIISGIEKNSEHKVTNVTNEKLNQLFNLYQIKTNDVEAAFPEFNEKDTLVVSSEGISFKTINFSKIYRITIGENLDRQMIINKLNEIPEVIYAEPNAFGRERVIPNDQYFGNQWALQPGTKIRTPEAWDIFTGTSNTIIGIVDGGRVQQNHPDLDGKVSGNFSAPISNHATHVAGISAAYGNNTTGIAGVNWNALINTQKIGDIPQQAAAIIAAVNAGSKIINNSWGQGSNDYSITVAVAFAYAYNSNVTSCNAMSATYSPEDYPNAYGQGIINVGATNIYDEYAQPYTLLKSYIDVSAPGGEDNAQIYSTISGSTYGNLYGTSMAAPHVTGIASLLKGYIPSLYNDDIENIIKISTDDRGAPGWDQYYGYGRVNAFKAIKFLQTPYFLNHITETGGSVHTTSNQFAMGIYGYSGLADGMYIVKRHEVRKTVTFPYRYDHYVWGRGVGSVGWNNNNIQHGTGFCDVVPGTITSNQATIRTYVYQVWSLSGSAYYGYHPTLPQNVSLNYTVLGKVMIAPIISNFTQNPVPICKGSSGYVQVNLSQGQGGLTYNWISENQPSYISIDRQGNRCYITYHYTEAGEGIEAPVWDFGCTVSNSVGQSTAYYSPALNPNCIGCPTLAFEQNGVLADENPLLITSLSNPGIDVTDYYLINTPAVPVNNQLKFTIHEPQTEHTWLDEVKLIGARVRTNELVAVTDDGVIVNYRKPRVPLRMMLNDSLDITEILSELDGEKVSVEAGDYISITINDLYLKGESVEGDEDNMIMGGEEPGPPQKRIAGNVWFTNNTDDVKDNLNTELNSESTIKDDLGNFFFRPNLSIICKRLSNLPSGKLQIEFTKDAELDYLVITRNLKTASVRELELIDANHILSGNVTSRLTGTDEVYAEILPGERIDFTFSASPNSNIAYVLKTTGRYETDTTLAFNKLASTSDEELVPRENKLFDNYPNPFNPTTQIKYSVKENGIVTLKIYDVLGKEVAELVNEEKQAGIYTVNFDGSSLSSGIYFYTISAKNFLQTKKMLLVK